VLTLDRSERPGFPVSFLRTTAVELSRVGISDCREPCRGQEEARA